MIIYIDYRKPDDLVLFEDYARGESFIATMRVNDYDILLCMIHYTDVAPDYVAFVKGADEEWGSPEQRLPLLLEHTEDATFEQFVDDVTDSCYEHRTTLKSIFK